MSAAPQRLADDLWRWTARHPEWHPGEFGAKVACFALRSGDDAVLIDPLLPPEPEPVLDLIEQILGERLSILVTVPYHVRSSEQVWQRFGTEVETTIWGHRASAKRLDDHSAFRELVPGAESGSQPGSDAQPPLGISAHRIGKPRRHEMPLHIPSHDALAFGDAVAEVNGELVVWSTERVDERVERFYRDRFNPTLEPLLELDVERVLVTHGEPVMRDGREELRKALGRRPWCRHS